MDNNKNLTILPCCHNCKNNNGIGMLKESDYACLDCENYCNFITRAYMVDPITITINEDE